MHLKGTLPCQGLNNVFLCISHTQLGMGVECMGFNNKYFWKTPRQPRLEIKKS